MRALFIGNIANNAYLNAKILRCKGIEVDVICANYYHIMGYPEWEDADFECDFENHFAPDWSNVDLGGYRRPRWFAQGPLDLCTKYLTSLHTGQAEEHSIYWNALKAVWTAPGTAVKRFGRLRRLFRRAGMLVKVLGRFDALRREYAKSFGGRADKLRLSDLTHYACDVPAMKRLFGLYDVVVGYSVEGVYPMLAGKRPYGVYEHGTIRNIPFQPGAAGRLCALSYSLADVSFITNCDNIVAAERLGLSNSRFVPHPVNEDVHVDERAEDLRLRLRRRLNSDFIVFHPSRQHWEQRRHPDWEKGNDIFIKGFARFVEEVDPRAAGVFVEWGQKVDESKALLRDLGVAERVLWIPPQPNVSMIRYIVACDLVADQFYLGAFGSTMPKALLHGCPAMLYLEEQRHRWCLPEMPPVVNARTPQEVFAGLKHLYDDVDYRRRLIETGRRWYDRYHSNRVIAETFSDAFRDLLLAGGDRRP